MPQRPLKAALARWYERYKRNLPWRNSSDPYQIWISEVILQQTRVDQGLSYFLAFLKRFPDIHSLARAREQTVLKIWQGLGYYSRARNMHATARHLSHKHNGRFPGNAQELVRLKGIGTYTAAAIASIAFNEPVAVVDGNVNRFLSRYFGLSTPAHSSLGRKRIHELADGILDRKNPGRHNQAVMELGALVCTPVNPQCNQCPVRQGCKARELGQQERFPVKTPSKTARPRHFNYLVIRFADQTLIQRRQGADIWKNLYEFPLVETSNFATISVAHLKSAGIWPQKGRYRITKTKSYRHTLSHQRLFVDFFEISLNQKPRLLNPRLRAVYMHKLAVYPVPRLIEKHLREMQVL